MLKHCSSSLAEFPMTSDGIYKKKIASFLFVSQYANKNSLTFNYTLEKGIIAFHFSLCWRRQWQPTPVLLPGNSHGRRSLVGCSPWGPEESDTTERLHFPFSLSCIGEGNGNPLQCSCLESPRDDGAWWAAFYGVTQSRMRLKQLSSSISHCVVNRVINKLVLSSQGLT